MSISPLDDFKDQVLYLLESGKSINFIAKKFDSSSRSVRRAIKRWNEYDDELTKEVSYDDLDNLDSITDPKTLMKELGLDPNEWTVREADVSRYGSPDTPQYSLKAKLERNIESLLIVPPKSKVQVKREYSKPAEGEPRFIVLCGDQHAPFHDKKLHDLFLDWLHVNKPHEGVLLGDTCDFPEISRHRHKPEWKASVQECLLSAHELLVDYVDTSSETKWVKLLGNHDDRLRNTIIDYNSDLFNLKRAYDRRQVDREASQSVWDLAFLLRLDDLGISLVRSSGTYDGAQYILSPKIAARHGWLAKSKSGTTATSTLEHLGHSIIIGHTHRRAFIYKTVHRLDGTVDELVSIESGCMCEAGKPTGLGYTPAPDWQQGFITLQIWPDGSFNADPATFVDGVLRWRDQIYY